jgi:pyruvate-ferredoxin/flavodoxin oxidoreductase
VTKQAKQLVVDGNEAAALIAHRLSEVIAIYPITPSSAMGELADAWSAAGRKNLWGDVPRVVEMQSEAGAAGALHGALSAGALCTTFTASQGLLLMLPNMYKIAGELTPTVFHVAARAVATHALSIFGDHSDVMAARTTGWALLCSSSVQEAHDLALIAHAATLESRIPFLHFFDGFRTSSEINKIAEIPEPAIRDLVDDRLIAEHRARRLDPNHPAVHGTAQNPDVFFQSREAANPYYQRVPDVVAGAMARFAGATGRAYRLFDYTGDPLAERVLVMMGSGAGAAEEAVTALNREGERVGLVTVRLYRPFSAAALAAALPETATRIAVLDRSKEAAALGEPLYQDVVTALAELGRRAEVIGGRYGLASKEFTPAMAAAALRELQQPAPRRHFTVGIDDDVTHLSLEVDDAFDPEPTDRVHAVFYGLGSDGTVGANKNSAKIIGEHTRLHAQGYFVYDSKKSGTITTSHLRFGPTPINSSYLVRSADFVACHNFGLLQRIDTLSIARPGATVLLNSPHRAARVWERIPVEDQRTIVERGLRVFVVDASRVAREAGIPGRVNTVLQTCFFALAGVLPRTEAIAAIKEAIKKSYAKRGEGIVAANFAAVDAALAGLEEVSVPAQVGGAVHRRAYEAQGAPDFVARVTVPMIAGFGDALPVSAFPPDGTYPSGTARWEKRSIAEEIPAWDPAICIDCAKCTLVCPHGALRMKVYDPGELAGAPAGFLAKEWRSKEQPGQVMTIQVAPDDCTGCGICADYCPVHDKANPLHRSIDLVAKDPILERERASWEFFLSLPEFDRTELKPATIKGSQMLEPRFEFPGACAGCGETPYLKLLSQLYGDRLLVANATGCSSIYGGNLPTTPWSVGRDGRGPAWANSLFEDNAEFGLGMRLAVDFRRTEARRRLAAEAPEGLARLDAIDQSSEVGIAAARAVVAELPPALREVGDALLRQTVWIVGGDGWAYDIGFGGLDHVLASGLDVNLLVLDTEVYSNTGGQSSKSTPRGAVARFASAGKRTRKKDLGLIAMSYGGVYVAQIALGADNVQAIKAIAEAESYPGPSLVIAYSHCIEHGIEMATGMTHQKEAVDSGYWPLYRFDPRREAGGEHPFQLDTKPPALPFGEFAAKETRFRPGELLAVEAHDVDARWRLYEQLAGVDRDDA